MHNERLIIGFSGPLHSQTIAKYKEKSPFSPKSASVAFSWIIMAGRVIFSIIVTLYDPLKCTSHAAFHGNTRRKIFTEKQALRNYGCGRSRGVREWGGMELQTYGPWTSDRRCQNRGRELVRIKIRGAFATDAEVLGRQYWNVQEVALQWQMKKARLEVFIVRLTPITMKFLEISLGTVWCCKGVVVVFFLCARRFARIWNSKLR